MVHLLVVLEDQPPPDAVRHLADVLPDALHGRVFVAISTAPVDNQNGVLQTRQAFCNFCPTSLPEEVCSSFLSYLGVRQNPSLSPKEMCRTQGPSFSVLVSTSLLTR